MRTSSKAAEKGKQKEQTAPKRLGDVKPGANHSKATRGFFRTRSKRLRDFNNKEHTARKRLENLRQRSKPLETDWRMRLESLTQRSKPLETD